MACPVGQVQDAVADKGRAAILAHGGQDGRDMLAAGADLLQIYSGFVFRGPRLIGELADALGDYRVGD